MKLSANQISTSRALANRRASAKPQFEIPPVMAHILWPFETYSLTKFFVFNSRPMFRKSWTLSISSAGFRNKVPASMNNSWSLKCSVSDFVRRSVRGTLPWEVFEPSGHMNGEQTVGKNF